MNVSQVLLACFVLFVVVSEAHGPFKKFKKLIKKLGKRSVDNHYTLKGIPPASSYGGIGFAGYEAPLQNFGGHNGRATIIAPGLDNEVLFPQNDDWVQDDITFNRKKRAIDQQNSQVIETAIRELTHNNNTMCTAEAVCVFALNNPAEALNLERFFRQSNVGGADFLRYATLVGIQKFEKCDSAFFGCNSDTTGETTDILLQTIIQRLAKYRA